MKLKEIGSFVIHRKKDSKDVFEELLTPTEVEMLSKRLALIFMLYKEVPFSRIVKSLKVSPSTVSRISKHLDRGGYESILQFVRKEKEVEDFLDAVEEGFRFGMPRVAGKGRWKNFGSRKQ